MTEVVLRARTDVDADALYAIAADLDTWERRSDSPPAPLTRAAYDARVSAHDGSDDVQFVIDVGGSAVGSCVLFGLDSFAQHAEVGISLGTDVTGRGIGTEAMRQLVEFGFVRRNLRRLHLRTLATNTAALRCYQKVGFVEEGRLREHVYDSGAWIDFVLMGLLRSEWQAARESS